MKKVIISLFILLDIILLGLSNNEFNIHKENYLSNNTIAAIYEDNILNYHNIYYQNRSFDYVSALKSNTINKKRDILNMIYTVINNGYDTFDFKCSDEYDTCYNDLVTILNNGHTLSIINNLVHPYNSVSNIELFFNSKLQELELKTNKLYTEDEIEVIEYQIDKIIGQITTPDMTDKQKIKKIHDYLSNNISYYHGFKSNTAYGALFYKEAICSGYSDTVSLFLYHLDIPNYKVVTNKHVWNVVYLDGKWLHLDLTYDDPVSIYTTNVSNYMYFLINTKEVISLDKYDHNLDLRVYSELS